jgi:hypothetical protein
MGEYFPYILSIVLVAFSSWLAIKLKFSVHENEVKSSIKKLFSRLLYASILVWYIYDLYALKTSSMELTRSEVFEIAYNIAVIFFIVLSLFILRLMDTLMRWLNHYNDFNKQHLNITKSIADIQESPAKKSISGE